MGGEGSGCLRKTGPPPGRRDSGRADAAMAGTGRRERRFPWDADHRARPRLARRFATKTSPTYALS